MLLLAGLFTSLFHPLAHANGFEKTVLDPSASPDRQFVQLVLQPQSAVQSEYDALKNHADHDGHFADAHCETCHVFAHFLLPIGNGMKSSVLQRLDQARPRQTLQNLRPITLDRPPRAVA